MNKLYTAQEVADRLKIKKTTVYELIKRGELESSKIGKQLRVSEEQLTLPKIVKKYLESHMGGMDTDSEADRIFHTLLLILNLRALC